MKALIGAQTLEQLQQENARLIALLEALAPDTPATAWKR